MPRPKQCTVCQSWLTTKSNLNRHFKHCHSTGNDKSTNENDEQQTDTRPATPETAELNYYNDQNGHGLITQILNSYEALTEEYNKLCETLKHNKRCMPKEKAPKRTHSSTCLLYTSRAHETDSYLVCRLLLE